MADSRRVVRVAGAVRQEVASFLAEKARDPRILGMVTVTGVDVTRDLRHAKVHVSILAAEEERDATLEGLESLKGSMRQHLARTLRLRVVPEITFKLDESIARAARIHQLLHGIERERQKEPGPGDIEPDVGDESR